MGNNKNRQEVMKTAVALPDDALGEVTGGRIETSGQPQFGRYWCSNRDWAVDDFSGRQSIYKICPNCGGTEIYFTNSIYL